jgi:hypothetical protein
MEDDPDIVVQPVSRFNKVMMTDTGTTLGINGKSARM